MKDSRPFKTPLNHLHFLQLVSVLRKRGGWGREERNLQDSQIPQVYPRLKEKQTKKHQCHPLSLTGNLNVPSFPPNCQENAAVLTRATSRCPQVMLCCFQLAWQHPVPLCPGGSCAVMRFCRLCSLSLQIHLMAFVAASPGMLGKAGVFLKSRSAGLLQASLSVEAG